MPLVKSTLANALADIFASGPSSVALAGQRWAQAYLSYASPALTSTGGAAVTASAGLPTLMGAFTSAFGALAPPSAAAAMAGGVTAFWQAMVWVGPGGAGVTVSPGNFALAAALAAVFTDLGESSASEKADRIADAFDGGAKLVIVMDTLPALTPVVVTGPIQ